MANATRRIRQTRRRLDEREEQLKTRSAYRSKCFLMYLCLVVLVSSFGIFTNVNDLLVSFQAYKSSSAVDHSSTLNDVPVVISTKAEHSASQKDRSEAIVSVITKREEVFSSTVPSLRRKAENGGKQKALASPPPSRLPDPATFFSLPAADRKVASLREKDKQKFTIRINSWKRPENLAKSVEHHSKCQHVGQVQVVWSRHQENINDEKSFVPKSVLMNRKVYVERRTTNSLNDRFDILPATPTETLGILSLDDDLLWDCSALKTGFDIWAKNPERMVTYTPRKHKIDAEGKWRYSTRDVYKSSKQERRKYTFGLTNTAFLHRDYLFFYTNYLPRDIYGFIHKKFNCEDIAMSVLVSNLTAVPVSKPCEENEVGCVHGNKQSYKVLAPLWPGVEAVETLETIGSGGISFGTDHKEVRSFCLNWFSKTLRYQEFFDNSSYAEAI